MIDYAEIFIGLLLLIVSYQMMQLIDFNGKIINKRSKKMNKEFELKRAWHKLVSVKEINERIVLKSDGVLNDSSFAVLSMIAFHPATTIAKIERHPFNANTSLSTIKRAVITLIAEDLITISSGVDGRERLMSIKEGV